MTVHVHFHSKDVHPGVQALADKWAKEGWGVSKISSDLVQLFRKQGDRITEAVRSDCQKAATQAVEKSHVKDMPSASRFKADPIMKGVFVYRNHYYRRVTGVRQIGQNKFDVTTTHGTYRLEGGKVIGGTRNDWFLEGPHLSKAIHVNGFIDGLNLLENM